MTLQLYLFCARDRDDAGSLRASVREAHRAWIRREDTACRCVLGGPLFGERGEMAGTALVFEAESASAVADFMAGDPYMAAGLFERVEIWPWRIGLGGIDRK
jgi:uncharacterized protein YciI